MDTHNDTGTRIIRRIEELLRTSTLPPDKVFNIMRRADANTGSDPTGEFERLQREQQKKD